MTSPAEQLARTPPATPPFDIVRSAYVELLVTDLAASEHFYVDLLGMIVSARTDDALYLRGWEERLHHSLVLRRGARSPGRGVRLGFRVRDRERPGPGRRALRREGLTTRWIDAGSDPGWDARCASGTRSAIPLEFFHEMSSSRPSSSASTSIAARRSCASITSTSTRPRGGDFRFWLELGFRCTEYISTDAATTSGSPAPGCCASRPSTTSR